jgi:15-cis-phytoene synthase/lycopene beta-cyclase
MVVLGMVTMDHAIALAQYDIVTSESPGRSLPSLGQIAWSYMAQNRKPLDVGFLDGLRAAVTELSRKSQSMYLGSAMFQDGLRVDLIFLSVKFPSLLLDCYENLTMLQILLLQGHRRFGRRGS